MDKLRLCEKCGISLEQKENKFYCPRGHGEWTIDQGLRDRPVRRFNGNLGKPYEAGAMVFTGGNKSGRKKKKPPRRSQKISDKYLET